MLFYIGVLYNCR